MIAHIINLSEVKKLVSNELHLLSSAGGFAAQVISLLCQLHKLSVYSKKKSLKYLLKNSFPLKFNFCLFAVFELSNYAAPLELLP